MEALWVLAAITLVSSYQSIPSQEPLVSLVLFHSSFAYKSGETLPKGMAMVRAYLIIIIVVNMSLLVGEKAKDAYNPTGTLRSVASSCAVRVANVGCCVNLWLISTHVTPQGP